ncbi:MAG: PqqD family protein [Candidatus Eremiobacteraeota bacterium]|nr:PqqD family protein [Candidatus Eremiobacteraeota bacterium]
MNRSQQLAISENGFIFDPTTGESFTTNQTGLAILNRLKKNESSMEIALKMREEFEVSLEELERDVADFIDHLRTYGLM